MYISKISNEQIKFFIEKYVKQYHINKRDCYDDANVYMHSITRKENYVELSTIIKDKTGFLEEKWTLTDLKGYKEWMLDHEELISLTKAWAAFMHECLYAQDKEIASNYKRAYIEKLEQERDSEISTAKTKFRERIF